MSKLPVPFGPWTTYAGHSGIDFPQPRGTIFRASGTGTVGLLKQTSAGGFMIWVDYDEIEKGNGVGYAHMDSFNGCPPVGTRVSEGTQLGFVGNSGHSTGPHLHIEMAHGGGGDAVWKWFDPNRVVGQGSGAGGSIAPNQRQVGANPANQRPQPNTSAPASNQLAPNTIGTFDGWVHGQSVEGNDIWFRGAYSGLWSWSGGFTDKGTHDLADLNAPTVQPHQRVVVPDGVNGRTTPSTSGQQVQFLEGGTVADFNGFTHGESVQNNDVWFRGAYQGNWFWSGGFTDSSTNGLPEIATDPITPPDPTPVPKPDNPRGLPEYPAVYPRAIKGLEAPLGFVDCKNPVQRSARTSKGSPPVPTSGVIDTFVIHWTSVDSDQLDYFSYCNDRSSCPSFYLRQSAQVFEMIRPGVKPASTGPEWNWRSIAVEVDSSANHPVTEAQLEELAQMVAWLAGFDGKTLDGSPVSFKIDRQHVVGHRDKVATACPGDLIYGKIDSIIARAQVIYAEAHPGVDPEPPSDVVTIPRATAEAMLSDAEFIAGSLRTAMG